MTTPNDKQFAIAVLGEPVGSQVARVTSRPPTVEETAPFEGGTLRLGDVIVFEMKAGKQ